VGFDPGAGTRGRGASAPGKAREAAEGRFLGGARGDACPMHDIHIPKTHIYIYTIRIYVYTFPLNLSIE
jgi:hypothetical protein